MTNMWDAATLDYEQERLDGYVAAASVAVADQHGFVLQASTRQEFDDRVAIVAEAVESAVGRVTHGDSASFPIVHQSVLASWEQDFDMVAEARQLETQRKNARRAYFRRQAGSRWTIFPLGDSRLEVELLDSYPQELKPETGFFIAITRQTEERYYGRLSGRTVQKWNMACPTIELYRINTVVIDGAIWGVRGDRVPGTWAIRPEATDELRRATASQHTAAGRFEWKWPGTRQADSMIVMPVSNLDANERIAQGSRSIVRFDTTTGKGVANWKGSDRKYFHHLTLGFGGAEEVTMPREFIEAALAVEYKSGDSIGGGVFVAAKSDEYAKTLINDKDDSDELIDWNAEKKKREGGFKVVDDDSGASSGTVYPNKEIADQAAYGEGYSVQYTEDTVKSASWERTGGLWVSHTGSRVMEVAEIEGRFVWGSYRTDDSVIAEGSAATLELAKQAASDKTAAAKWETGDHYEGDDSSDEEVLYLDNEWGDHLAVYFDTYDKTWMWSYSQGGPSMRGGKSGSASSKEQAKEKAMSEYRRAGGSLDLDGSRYSSKTSARNWKQQDGYGWHLTPADMDRRHWARIVEDTSGLGGFFVTIFNTDGGEYDTDTIATQDAFGDLEGAKAYVERFIANPWKTSSKTAGENPFAKKDDDKKAAPKNDTTDSDKDGEQDGPTQPGEQPEPAGNDAKAAPAAPADPAAAPAADPAAQAPADQQQAPADPNAPQADPAAVDATGQDKGQAQDPASTSDAVQDQQQPADPTVMDVGQSTSMGFTMVEGGSAGSIEVTFVREENGVYFFNGPTGEFGVGQMNGQWQDADGNTFTFGGASPAPQGIGPAQEQAAAADAATPVPTPAGNAQAAPQGAQPAASPPVAAPAKDDSANPADTPAPDAEKKDDAPPAKDDGEKKENPFAKKSGS